jgi:GrxC family glutaredoxin
MRDLI